MENKNHGDYHARPERRGGGNTFVWGLLIGAVLTTLLTTQKGRRILREVADLGFELLEDFIEDRVGKREATNSTSQDETEEVKEDLESEVAEVETATTSRQSSGQAESTEKDSDEKIEEVNVPKTNGNGHKKRLFRGIRRNK